MATYPGGVYSPRTKENKSGVVYDAGKTTIGYAEDVTKLDDEVVAVETELGTEPSGIYDTVKLWLTALTTLLGVHKTRHENGGDDEISVAGLSGELADNQPPKAHNLGGAGHSEDTLANLNLKVSDATLIDTADARLSDARTPEAHKASHENGGGDEISVAGLSGELADDQPPKAHKADHQNGGGDEINVGGLSGELADDQPPKAHKADHAVGGDDILSEADIGVLHAIVFIIDGGGSAITTGEKGHLEIPFACEIQRATLLADVSGSIVIDIWKDTYALFPPTVADTITAAAKPTLAAAQKVQDSTLTGWTKAIAAGDILAFNVDSAATVTRVVLVLKVKRI